MERALSKDHSRDFMEEFMRRNNRTMIEFSSEIIVKYR